MATSGSPQPLELTATPVPASTPSSAEAFVSAPDSAGVSATTPDSAGASPSTADSAAVSATTPDSAGASPSTADSAAVSATTPVSAAPAPTASGSTVTDVVTSSSVAPATSVPDSGVPAAPAVLRLLACPRGQSARQSHGDSVSRALTAGSGVSSTSTQSTVPTPGQGMVSPSGRPRRASAINAARLSSHYLGELKVSDRVALGLGDSAGSSPDSAMQGEGSSAQPLELSGDSSDGEPEGTVVSSPESASGREQLGHREGSAVSGPKARAPASSAPASDGDDSSQDSDDVPIRDIVSRMQTGRNTPRGNRSVRLLSGIPSASTSTSISASTTTSTSTGSPLVQATLARLATEVLPRSASEVYHRLGWWSSVSEEEPTDPFFAELVFVGFASFDECVVCDGPPHRLDWFSSDGGYSHFRP
ncbi:unnamed protein product [Phytophthora fragariaefolia]|uniref:Unnamed protein product n=1 Tax=Phytophthora fragariaefolia TaxID=1490495 RepID=A0A9W7D7K6_9STRA|nr:unnamed protein product [Phytophthora fragariaefolia]